jgi:hypothetical protein
MAQVTLNQVADHIEAHLDQFDMLKYSDLCGTAGCVAWHAAVCSGASQPIDGIGTPIDEIAAEALGIENADELFLAFSLARQQHPLDLNFINKHKTYVPAALRWMAENEIDWAEALAAVGVELPA